jgi:serine/threonine protein kinase KIN1/2
MATATSSTTPTVVRSTSTRASNNSTELPSRHRSTTQRPVSSSLRSPSRSQPLDPPVSNQATLANVARRDHETTNLTRRPSSRRNSTTRDAHTEGGQQYHTETSRGHHRDHSSARSTRNSADMSAGGQTVITNGSSTHNSGAPSTVHTDKSVAPAHPPMGRRRTSISTVTGTWSLGKTIGQGSMGKVKLARNSETGEQVSKD